MLLGRGVTMPCSVVGPLASPANPWPLGWTAELRRRLLSLQVCNIPNSMTILDDLLPIALVMSERKLTGAYNFTNPGAISHNEILDLYKEVRVQYPFPYASVCVRACTCVYVCICA